MRNKRKEDKLRIEASLSFYAGETTIGTKDSKGGTMGKVSIPLKSV